jgi:predicted glycosyltransferase
MNSDELELALNASEIILSRSGYTTIMDLAKIEKKAFFIPTPGQYEQEYLAYRLEKEGIAPYSSQENFTLEKLQELDRYSGFKDIFDWPEDYGKLFDFFQSERKLRS